MGVKKRPITALIESTKWTSGKSVWSQLKAADQRKISSDLIEVACANAKGLPIPSALKLRDFFAKEYGVDVGRTVVQNWLKLTLAGKPIR